MKQGHLDARVDMYVEGAAEFARPVLRHVRGLIHRACGEVEETIKWSRPFFLYRGQIVVNMAAFKAHCSLNLWGPGMKTLRSEEVGGADPHSPLARLTCLASLPDDVVLLTWLKTAFQAAEKAAAGTTDAPRRQKPTVPEERLAAPEELTAALAKVPGAVGRFAALSESCRREYVEWITDAKRPETRQRRVAESVAWIVEGKRRNWKYEARPSIES